MLYVEDNLISQHNNGHDRLLHGHNKKKESMIQVNQRLYELVSTVLEYFSIYMCSVFFKHLV